MNQARATDRTHTNADPIHHRLAICLCVVTREHPSANSIFLPFFLVSLLCEIVAAIMMLAGGRCHEFSIGETDNQRIGGSGIICVSFFSGQKLSFASLLIRVQISIARVFFSLCLDSVVEKLDPTRSVQVHCPCLFGQLRNRSGATPARTRPFHL
jgi:hypothetical protein